MQAFENILNARIYRDSIVLNLEDSQNGINKEEGVSNANSTKSWIVQSSEISVNMVSMC